MMKPRIALAHDWLVGLRGGEWVLDRLARLYGPTDLYTLVDNGGFITNAIAQCRVITSPLQQLPFANGPWRRHYLPFMPLAVESMFVKRCDLLISVSAAVIKSIRTPPDVPHLCYCNSPARYIWEQTEDYGIGSGGRIRSLGLRAVRKPFQDWDRRTASRVTKFLANSNHTAARILRCFGRDATVVYPPVQTNFFTPDESVPREDWFLVVSALEPYKRTDLVIEAANRAEFHLKVVGDGSQYEALSEQAGPTVDMLGYVTGDDLVSLYRRAKALIFPQKEDFGLTAVEAQATGCPVIAFASGGALETITNLTGIFFSEQSVESIIDAASQFELKSFVTNDCREQSLRFCEDAFDTAIQREVAAVLHSS